MTKLLINEPPLQVLPSLANRIGLNEAIALQQLHWLLGSRHPSVVALEDGRWFRASVSFWVSEFPFWSEATIKRAWASLREMGLVETSRGREASTYTIVYSRLDQIDPADGSERSGHTDQIDPSLIKEDSRPTTREEQPVADATGDQLFETQDAPATAKKVAELRIEVETIWLHYVQLFNPPRKELTDSRRRLIERALKECAPMEDRVDYLKSAVTGLHVWRSQKQGDNSLSAVFQTRPGGSTLGDQLQFFVDQATSGGTSASPKVPSVLSGTISARKREVLDMLAYPDSPDHKERGLAAMEWLKNEAATEPIISASGQLQGWQAVRS